MVEIKFCTQCGSSKIDFSIPENDNRPRFICIDCSYIHYLNPKIVVGCIPAYEDKVLICKRSIAPRKGFWTIPCGFMENAETAEEGAQRETLEEANARVKIKSLHTVYSLPHINQVYLLFLSELQDLDFSAADETEEVKLVNEDELPFDRLAFTSINFALKNYFEDRRLNRSMVHIGSLPADTMRLH